MALAPKKKPLKSTFIDSGHQIKARCQQNVRVVLLPYYYAEIVKLTCWVRWDIVSSFKRIIAKIFEGEIQ